MIDISVIIVNYNTQDLTLQCIHSIYEKTKDITFEIIVVDNASQDKSVQSIKKEYPEVILIKSSKNLGFGRANNLGYKHARGKYIFLLNSDTLLLNNAIKHFFDCAEKSPNNIACFGTMLLDEEGHFIHSFASFPSKWRILKRLLNHYTRILNWDISGDNKTLQNKGKPFFVDYITGAALFIRNNIIQELGLFDPLFFMYYEETDMQLKYNNSGYYSIIIDSPKIIHLHGKNTKKSISGLYLSTDGCFRYFKKNFNRFDYYIIRFLHLIILLPKIIIYPANIFSKKRLIKLLFSL